MIQFLARGENTINGFRNANLRIFLYGDLREDATKRRRASGRASRRLALLRAHGMIKKVGKTNRYLLTPKGQRVASAVLSASSASSADTQQLLELAA